MEIVTEVREMQLLADQQRMVGKKLALVPTMGALHEGHLRLVRRAVEIADHVTVSIFVNPTQFGPGEDFQDYPREQEADVRRLRAIGRVDAVYMPTTEMMYTHGKKGHVTWVVVDRMDRYLCGKYREGHFRGVTTVVSKLFNTCKPHVGVFGLKDAQQFLILKRMVHDLNFDIAIEGVPTHREEDGLAASSRNVYLSMEHRKQAPTIYRALLSTKALIEAGERDGEVIRDHLASMISDNTEGEVQYAEVVDTELIHPLVSMPPGKEVLVAVAVLFGKTRLIDNVFVQVPGTS